MEKKQDSGLSCFMIVMKFHGIPITKEQAENLSVLDPEQKTGEIEIIQSAKALKMRAKLCKLKLNKLKSVTAPIIAKDKNDEFFIIAKSKEDKFMVLFADKTQPEKNLRKYGTEQRSLLPKKESWTERLFSALNGSFQQY